MKLLIFMFLVFLSGFLIGMGYNYIGRNLFKFIVEAYIWTSVYGLTDYATKGIEWLFKRYSNK